MLLAKYTHGNFRIVWKGTKVNLIFSSLTYCAIIWVFIAQILPDIGISSILYALVFLQTCRLSCRGFNSSIDIAIGASFLLLYFMFAPNLLLHAGIDSSISVSIFILFTDVLRKFSGHASAPDKKGTKLGAGRKAYAWIGLSSSSLAIALTHYLLPVPIFSLMLPVGCAIYFQERLLLSGQSFKDALFSLAIVLLGVGYYMIFHWGGFGRLAIAAFILMPLMTIAAHKKSLLKFWHIAVALPFLTAWAAIIRGGSALDFFNRVAVGVTDHLRFTEELRSGALQTDAGLSKFFDQYLMFFFNWVPRNLWSGKPTGAGYYSVDLMLGREAFGEEYSISLGFVGDQIFVLGGWYLFGLAIILMTMTFTRSLIKRVSPTDVKTPLIAFDASLLTFFWGGMAAFGSRAWFVIVPILTLALLSRMKISRR